MVKDNSHALSISDFNHGRTNKREMRRKEWAKPQTWNYKQEISKCFSMCKNFGGAHYELGSHENR